VRSVLVRHGVEVYRKMTGDRLGKCKCLSRILTMKRSTLKCSEAMANTDDMYRRRRALLSVSQGEGKACNSPTEQLVGIIVCEGDGRRGGDRY
jgi:hypothetical protein